MSIAANQQRTFLRLLAELQPHWRRDAALPARIQMLLARHREFGSRDRRLYRELVYTTLRYLPWIEPVLDAQPVEAVRRVAWFAADIPATQTFRAAHATGAPPHGDVTELIPAWFRPHCPELFTAPEAETQVRRAPVWLRLQTSESQRVFEEFKSRGWPWRESRPLPTAIALLADADVTKTDAFRAGFVEVQDLGSQLLLETIGLAPGERWLDACAGAGGKTLQLARLLGPSGHIDAHDIRPGALDELEARARRAGLPVVAVDDRGKARAEPRRDSAGGHGSPLQNPPSGASIATLHSSSAFSAGYDGVLVDAPCSGSGTWRRAPHLKWTTTEANVARAAETQAALLHDFSALVRPGGRLVYATCSLSARENEDVVNRFLAAHPAFHPEPFARTFETTARGAGRLILPSVHDTDGFFVASLRRMK